MSSSTNPITPSGLSNYSIAFAPGGILGGKGPQRKTDAQKLDIELRLNERIEHASDAFRAQNEMHKLAHMKGESHSGGWYAVLPDGETDYEKAFWVNTLDGADEVSRGLFERFKLEAVLGNPAGVYMLFRALTSTLHGMEGGGRVSEERLGRQLEAEYGINPVPIANKVESDDSESCEEALMVQDLLLDISP
ncbi:hypothetical protein Hypma_011974 [Hypsizygus marmoreus]|uniref:Uncharacterized protein n=1 Tax=Hypsizygus marmoreus TaxID=39966 RepID=A0A369JHR2_HYPMA|nr:hypothetical protein Hypma_011974 [Hypsizygus marmoreus]